MKPLFIVCVYILTYVFYYYTLFLFYGRLSTILFFAALQTHFFCTTCLARHSFRMFFL